MFRGWSLEGVELLWLLTMAKAGALDGASRAGDALAALASLEFSSHRADCGYGSLLCVHAWSHVIRSCRMSRKLPLAEGRVARTVTARVLLRGGVDEKSGEALTARVVAERVGRCADLVVGMVAGILATWPADPDKRTQAEWDAVREAIPDGRARPSSVIKARTRQITAFADGRGRLPVDVFELEEAPRAARMLVLAAVDQQQATLQRAEDDPARVLLPESARGSGVLPPRPQG
jgi:hypothetical protein